MKHYRLVRIKTNQKSKILLKLNKINISMRNIRFQDNYVYFEVNDNDIRRIKKYLISEKIEIIDDTGIYKIKKEIKNNLLFITSTIFACIIFLILSNIIVKVNVVHSDSHLRELLLEALKERGVENLTFKKSYNEYESIIESIKKEYKDKIEWLEIDVDGMVINVRVEERIVNSFEKKYDTCHIVASKSGIIKNILTKKGVSEVRINDYVERGDILINGMIKLNEEIKNNVCAEGEVYAEVWYTIKGSIPLEYEEKEYTKKMRYNFLLKTPIEEYEILKSRVGENKEVKKKRLFKLNNYEFYLAKEYETKVTKKTYTEEEALKELNNQIAQKLMLKGSKNSDIIEQKVLKKSVNNGNLDIEVFVAIKEQIGVVEHYDVEMESDTNDKEYRGDNINISR